MTNQIKITTITYSTAENYGALLQAYALKRYLESMSGNVSVTVLNYAPDKLVDRYRFVPHYVKGKNIKEKMKYVFINLAHNIYYAKPLLKRKKRMHDFMDNYLKLSGKAVKCADDMRQDESDIFVIGSDQVWNPSITLGMDDVFWGNFPRKKSAIIISYAASIGKNELNQEEKYVKECFSNFAAISVREHSSYKFVTDNYNGEVVENIDPVFLIECSKWERIAVTPKRKKYVILFYTEKDNGLINAAKTISKNLNAELLCLNYTKKEKSIADAGPCEMIGYIKNAECVVTNSFHGCAFSCIFHKKVYWRTHRQFGNRIDDLMSSFHISCGIDEVGNVTNEVSWEFVDDVIRTKVKEANSYLSRYIK